MSRTSYRLLLLVTLALATAPGLASGPPRLLAADALPPPAGAAQPRLACEELRFDPARRASSLVLVVNDTMRRDRAGAYGGPARTPAFDAFARENLLATRSPGADGEERYLFHEGVMFKPGNRAIRSGTQKLILQPQDGPEATRDALFDLAGDPSEARNLLAGQPRGAEIEAIHSALLEAAGRAVRPFARPLRESTEIVPELLERLRALGYVQ